jgi:hypothetical protein
MAQTGGRMRMLDFVRAFNGPGLLDLASRPGTTEDPDPGRVEGLLHRYVAVGGTEHVLHQRGGLPAAEWALGWHRPGPPAGASTAPPPGLLAVRPIRPG